MQRAETNTIAGRNRPQVSPESSGEDLCNNYTPTSPDKEPPLAPAPAFPRRPGAATGKVPIHPTWLARV